MSQLLDKINNRADGIILYGITPPKKGTEPSKTAEIANRQIQRLSSLPIDGLVVYDIQDEKERTQWRRPFPFLETQDGYTYSEHYLGALNIPKVIYRAVGKYSRAELTNFIRRCIDPYCAVFVGAAASEQAVRLSLSEAYSLTNEVNPNLCLGGVTIPERHHGKKDEHIRVFNKIKLGCRFFVSQGVYDVNAAKDFLSDYYYYGQENSIALVPIIFTLTPCGSLKTLDFMKWLGIHFPRWLENELLHSSDILQKSVDLAVANWKELHDFAGEKGIPVGCNIESVAIRKVEIEASVELLQRVVGQSKVL